MSSTIYIPYTRHDDYNKLIDFYPAEKQGEAYNLASLLFDLILKEISWLHTNPALYKDSCVPDLYFVKDDNSKENLNLIENILKYSKKFIFIRGNKGIGKTITQNYFLNKKTYPFLNEELRATWVRIDFAKIFELSGNYPYIFKVLKRKNILIESYLYSQLLYVYTRYSKYDSILKKVNLNIPKELVEEMQSAPNFDNSLTGKLWKFMVDRESFSFFKKLSLDLLKQIQNNGDKIILILDGLDNVDYDLSLGHIIFSELNNFLSKVKDFFESIMIFCRPETCDKLQHVILGKFITYRNFREVKLKSVSLNSILKHIYTLFFKPDKILRILFKTEKAFEDSTFKKKFNKAYKFVEKELNSFISSNPTNHFQDIILKNKLRDEFGNDIRKYYLIILLKLWREYGSNKIPQEFTSFIREYYVPVFFEKLKDYNLIDEDTKLKEGQKVELVVEKVFRRNIRDFLLNTRRTYGYIKNYIDKKEFSSFKEYFKGSFNIDKNEQQKELKESFNFKEVKNRRKSIIFEAAFKHGRLYAPSLKDKSYVPPYKSFPFTNLLNPAFSLKYTDISPIIVFKLFDILIQRKGKKIYLRDLIEELGINPDKINAFYKNILTPLEEYGYLEIFPHQILVERKIKLTDKGLFVFRLSFEDINVLTTYIFNGYFSKAQPFYDEKNSKWIFKLYTSGWSDYISTTLWNFFIITFFLYEEARKINWDKKFLEYLRNKALHQQLNMFFSELSEDLRSSLIEDLISYSIKIDKVFLIHNSCKEILEYIKGENFPLYQQILKLLIDSFIRRFNKKYSKILGSNEEFFKYLKFDIYSDYNISVFETPEDFLEFEEFKNSEKGDKYRQDLVFMQLKYELKKELCKRLEELYKEFSNLHNNNKDFYNFLRFLIKELRYQQNPTFHR